ncbi:hypothetical protein DDM98_14925 [Vibrio cholerae]|nr:hypothetical protein [Vibrio cholerae]
MKSVTIKDSITSLLMRPTSVGKDTQHKLGQPLKILAYVSNHRGPLLFRYCTPRIKWPNVLSHYNQG